VQATLEAYQTLEGFVDAGKIITLGISNIYDPKLLEWLLGKVRVKVGVVQNRWYEGNGFDWKGEGAVLDRFPNLYRCH
jgi:aryl-alcohol dehydrogenase-like predicted oxidoreductase